MKILWRMSILFFVLFICFRMVIVGWVLPIYWIITGKILDVENFVYDGKLVHQWEDKIFGD